MTYRYNAGGLPMRVDGKYEGKDYAYVRRMDYDKFEQRLFVELGNGVTSRYSYDVRTRRLAQLSSASSLGVFQDLAYVYDRVGNVLSLGNAAQAVSNLGGPVSQSFGYDDLYRLTSAEGEFRPSSNHVERYTLSMGYDDIHNIIQKTQKHESAGVNGSFSTSPRTSYEYGYTYGGKPHAPVRIGDRTFTYDASGNQTGFEDAQNNTRRVISWDEENRIDSLSDNGRTHLYSYDDSGERSIKDADRQGITAYVSQYYTMRNATLGTKHVYVGTTRMASKLLGGMTYLRGKSGKPTTPVPPPGGEPTGPGQGTLHRSPQAALHAQNTLKNPHYADPSQPLTVVQEGGASLDNPAYSDWEYAFPESYDVATIGGGSEHLYFYHADHLGSTGYVTREDAALVEHVQYFPFGETWIQEGKHTERYPYLFTSKELDEESGLYYFGARYYDPRTSVWQSPDPALGEYLPARVQRGLLPGMGGIYNSFNLGSYTYAHLSPLKVRDPDGRIALVDDAIIGASIIVIGGTAYVMSNPENRKAIARQVGQGIENFETNTQRAIEKIKNIFYNEQGNTEESNSDTGKAQSNPAKGRDDTEHSSYDDALKGAREKAGNLGEDAEKMYDPETGTQIGEQSADSKRGWRIDDDHVNWWDWSGGKKGQGGKYGHEFFPEEQAGPHSKYPGYSEWE